MVNKQALGTLVSLLMVILGRDRSNRWGTGAPLLHPSLNPALQLWLKCHLLLETFLNLFNQKAL